MSLAAVVIFWVAIWIILQDAKLEIFPHINQLICDCSALTKVKLLPKLNAEQKGRKWSKSSP